ncbi:MAG: type II toxin-antitoxin system death-on-curing family toxin [Oscillospiraceae bacterium]|nr:type II toxin-antitoxin system death-on-curing family toxin [Oscillospiraceae bacterium]
MIALTIEEIILLHEKIIAVTGGASGLRDYGLLESAVFGCYQSFGGQDIYPTVLEKAAGLAYAICNNHAFIDGNKRIAVTAMLVFLRMNDIKLNYTQQELISLGLGMASGSMSYEDVRAWLFIKKIN